MKELVPKITTRIDKGIRLTHNEMDTNLCSLLHTVSLSETSSFKDAQYATFSYASKSISETDPEKEQAKDIVIPVRESSTEICKKLSGETIPGDLWVSGALHVNDIIYESFNPISGSVQSDRNLKENIYPFYNSLDRATQIVPVNFTWKPKAERSGADVGVIAQEVQKVYPDAVIMGSDGYLRVDYIKLIPLLLGAVNELANRVYFLEQKRQ